MTEMQREHDQNVLESYLMIGDYIHIPSKDLHLKIEDDIKRFIIFFLY